MAATHQSLYLRAERANQAAAEATQAPWQAVGIADGDNRISDGVSIMRETPEGLSEELIVMPGADPQDSADAYFIAVHHDHIALINDLVEALRAASAPGVQPETRAQPARAPEDVQRGADADRLAEELDKAADHHDFIASTTTDKKARQTHFGAEKVLRDAATLILNYPESITPAIRPVAMGAQYAAIQAQPTLAAPSADGIATSASEAKGK